MKNRQLFAARFRKLRQELRLSQRNLAKKIGLTGNTQVSKFENGTSEPSLETLRKLAALSSIDVYIDLHELITGGISRAVTVWQEEYRTVLELLAKYVSSETARLLEERRRLWGELGVADDKQQKGVVGADDQVAFWKAEIARIEERIADVVDDQHYVQEALSGMRK